MPHNLKLSLFGIATLAVALTTGCNTQPQHPNQLNAFDGATYNSLTLAHAALTSLRVQVPTVAPRYIPTFNQAAAAYELAFNAYAGFRSQPANSVAVTTEIADLTISIVSLESALTAGMKANPQTAAEIRQKAFKLRARTGGRVSVPDILTELEIAAAVAETIPAGQPYSQIAMIVIQATGQALAIEEATAGQPIDLNLIAPVLPIQ
jgi:hypothetical protein